MEFDLSLKLSNVQKDWVKKGKIESVSDLLAVSPQEWAYKWKTSVASVNELIDIFLKNIPLPQSLDINDFEGRSLKCTTGDRLFDEALGGGIRQGMVWEVVGESAAGKTQVALQLALCAQLPVEKGGFFGSTCFLTTSSVLPTTRLKQISESHTLLASSGCELDYVLTQSTTSVPMLLHVLQVTLPALVESRAKSAGSRHPVKLLILDAIAELFHTTDKTTTNTLVERSKNLAQIGFLLHTLASKYGLAILVLNEVTESFDRDYDDGLETKQLLYQQQARWFGKPPYGTKEAALGLVWANQVNTRIFLTRTGRRRHLNEDEVTSKRPKGDGIAQTDSPDQAGNDMESNELVLIRRLSVVFSSTCRPASFDYIVTQFGVSGVPGTLEYAAVGSSSVASVAVEAAIPAPGGSTVAERLPLEAEPPVGGADEWDEYWATEDQNADLYSALGDAFDDEEIIPSTEEQGVMD